MTEFRRTDERSIPTGGMLPGLLWSPKDTIQARPQIAPLLEMALVPAYSLENLAAPVFHPTAVHAVSGTSPDAAGEVIS